MNKVLIGGHKCILDWENYVNQKIQVFLMSFLQGPHLCNIQSKFSYRKDFNAINLKYSIINITYLSSPTSVNWWGFTALLPILLHLMTIKEFIFYGLQWINKIVHFFLWSQDWCLRRQSTTKIKRHQFFSLHQYKCVY